MRAIGLTLAMLVAAASAATAQTVSVSGNGFAAIISNANSFASAGSVNTSTFGANGSFTSTGAVASNLPLPRLSLANTANFGFSASINGMSLNASLGGNTSLTAPSTP